MRIAPASGWMESPTMRTLMLCSLGVTACFGLLAGRILLYAQQSYLFLVWNLFLACVPFFAALAFVLTVEKLRLFASGLFTIWLLFLPNAPYLATDFVHLRSRPPVPLWYDALLFTAFAFLGLALGYHSLAVMQAWVARHRGRLTGWLFCFGILGLCSVGLYVGRVLRWNSWDVFARPHELLPVIGTRIVDPFGNPLLLVFLGVAFLFLVAGYVCVLLLQRAPLFRPDQPGRREE